MSKQTLTNIERGQGTSQLNLILQICHGLGIQLRIVPWVTDEEASNEWH